MATQVRLRRGTTAEHTAFTGAVAEVTVDTSKKTLVVHDGATAGGVELVNVSAAQTLTNKTLTSPDINGGTIDNVVIGGDTPAAITGTTGTFGTSVRGTTANGFLDLFGDSGASVGLRYTDAGLLLLGDTANANMTQGLTINQGANDDEIFALKSSDVAHGVTTITETDTYGMIVKRSAAIGGMRVRGLSSGTIGIALDGVEATNNTSKATNGTGTIHIAASLKSGTGVTDCGADANLLSIRNHLTTRFLFDAEGSAHADVEWTTFDRHDDLAVIESMETLLAPDFVQRQFGDVMKYNRDFFEDTGLLHDVREVGEGKTRGMLNTTRALMLSFGAHRQTASRVASVEDVLSELMDLNPNLTLGPKSQQLLN